MIETLNKLHSRYVVTKGEVLCVVFLVVEALADSRTYRYSLEIKEKDKNLKID